MAFQRKSKSSTGLKAKLDKVFSLYIRLRDCDENGTFRCISCNRILPFEQGDCGHYVNRQHMALRWNELNCNIQCRRCNRFDEGNIQGYRQGLVRKYGEQQVLLLESRKYETKKWTQFELETLIKYYEGEVKRLRKEKRL
jgi:hypothetical protein